jgi:hypothetical protein
MFTLQKKSMFFSNFYLDFTQCNHAHTALMSQGKKCIYVFSMFQYHIFYVLYPFGTYLMTRPRKMHKYNIHDSSHSSQFLPVLLCKWSLLSMKHIYLDFNPTHVREILVITWRHIPHTQIIKRTN